MGSAVYSSPLRSFRVFKVPFNPNHSMIPCSPLEELCASPNPCPTVRGSFEGVYEMRAWPRPSISFLPWAFAKLLFSAFTASLAPAACLTPLGCSCSFCQDKKYASDKYKDIYTELSIVKAKADCDISRLKEQLKAATEAQGEKSPVNTTVSGYGQCSSMGFLSLTHASWHPSPCVAIGPSRGLAMRLFCCFMLLPTSTPCSGAALLWQFLLPAHKWEVDGI